MDVTVGQYNNANDSQLLLKHGKLVGSKNRNLQTRKWAFKKNDPSENVKILKESSDIIDISVPKQIVKYMKIIYFLLSLVEFDGTDMKSMLVTFCI